MKANYSLAIGDDMNQIQSLLPAAVINKLALAAERNSIARALIHEHAEISPKYFYDELGSKLFEAICQLDEYYLTRCEARILGSSIDEIRQEVGAGVILVDLGAGNCEKAASLFPVLQPSVYVPIDISVSFMKTAVAKLQEQHPDIQMWPTAMDFTQEFSLPPNLEDQQLLFFYPGSSLGNFSPKEAECFLRQLRRACPGQNQAGILIGIDLVKESQRLEAAYDDALGVTAAFNLNILNNINKILKSDFCVADWGHKAMFSCDYGRIEMYLEAKANVDVAWPDGARTFVKGERIHTENSYKYTKSGIVSLLARAGFGDARLWSDPEETFLVCYAKAI